MDLNNIPTQGSWNDAASAISDNFNKVNVEVEKQKSATTKFKGYFPTVALLTSAVPSPKIGDTAWVGATYPGVVYDCITNGTWRATTTVPDTGSVDLTGYIQQSDLTQTIGTSTTKAPSEKAVGDAMAKIIESGGNAINLSFNLLPDLVQGGISSIGVTDTTAANRIRTDLFKIDFLDEIIAEITNSNWDVNAYYYDLNKAFIENTGWVKRAAPIIKGSSRAYIAFAFRKTDNSNLSPSDFPHSDFSIKYLSALTTEMQQSIEKVDEISTLVQGDSFKYNGNWNIGRVTLTGTIDTTATAYRYSDRISVMSNQDYYYELYGSELVLIVAAYDSSNNLIQSIVGPIGTGTGTIKFDSNVSYVIISNYLANLASPIFKYQGTNTGMIGLLPSGYSYQDLDISNIEIGSISTSGTDQSNTDGSRWRTKDYIHTYSFLDINIRTSSKSYQVVVYEYLSDKTYSRQQIISTKSKVNLTTNTNFIRFVFRTSDNQVLTESEIANNFSISCNLHGEEAIATKTETLMGLNKVHVLRKYLTMPNSFFRIPGLIATNSGRLILSADRRIGSVADETKIDAIIMRSSYDKSKWEAPRIIHEHTNISDWDRRADTTILYSKSTDRLFLFSFKSTTKVRWQDTHIVPSPQIFDFIYKYSDDEGVTWSQEISLQSLFPANCVIMFGGTGAGIEMANGTLVMPIQCKMATSNTSDTANNVGFNIQSGIMYSTDNGITWTVGTSLVPAYTSECMIVECEPNKIMLNARGYISKRRVFTTSDMGTTWIASGADKTIIEPTACQASFYKYQVGYKSLGLFCNPHSTESRSSITIQSTKDYINYHPIITINSPIGMGYSCIASDNDGNLYAAYESDMNGNIYLACLNKYIPFMLDV